MNPWTERKMKVANLNNREKITKLKKWWKMEKKNKKLWNYNKRSWKEKRKSTGLKKKKEKVLEEIMVKSFQIWQESWDDSRSWAYPRQD